MKILKIAIYTLLVLLCSCKETLPRDSSNKDMNKLIAESHKLYDQYYSSKTDNVVDKSQYSDFLKKFKIKNIVLRNNTIELIESMEPVHGIIILRDKNIIYKNSIHKLIKINDFAFEYKLLD